MKKWILIALVLIAVGIAGATAYGFKFGKPLPDYRQQWTFGANELRNLSVKLDSSSAQIEFVPSTDGKNTITLEGKADQRVIDRLETAKVQDGQLAVDLNEPWTWFSFSLDFSSHRQHMTVALTEQAAQALDAVSVKSDSGALTVSGVTARTADFEADSGSIRLDGYQGESLKLRTDSGSIHADNVHGQLDASSDSGSQSVQHLTGAAKLEADSGSITLQKDDVTGADLKTDSGSVRIQLPSAFGGSFDLRSDSGSIRAPESVGTSPEVVKVRTDSGSIRIEKQS